MKGLTQQRIESKMGNLSKKIELLKKKKDTMGLSQDEKEQYEDMIVEFLLLKEELVDLKVEEWIFSQLYNEKTEQYLTNIQKYIPWNGKTVIRKKDAELIINSEKELTNEQREELINNLMLLHREILLQFEKFFNNFDDMDFLLELSAFIGNRSEEEKNIFDLIQFIDLRYRTIGELIGYELPELEIDFI